MFSSRALASACRGATIVRRGVVIACRGAGAGRRAVVAAASLRRKSSFGVLEVGEVRAVSRRTRGTEHSKEGGCIWSTPVSCS